MYAMAFSMTILNCHKKQSKTTPLIENQATFEKLLRVLYIYTKNVSYHINSLIKPTSVSCWGTAITTAISLIMC